jgi:hypothetical protein
VTPTRQDPQQIKLTATTLAAIKLIAESEDMPPGSRLYATLMLVWGEAWYARQTEVDPEALSIPREQWLEVAGYLTHGVAIDSIAGVNLGLDWMNKGPTSHG